MPVLTDLVLEHYTDQPFTFERRTYAQKPPMEYLKPIGLWVSVAGEDDWPSWCRDQEFCLSSLNHCSIVVPRPDADVLLVSTPGELDAFHDKYAVATEDTFTPLRALEDDDKKYWSLDWHAAAADYDGIVIAPYLWSRRLDGPMWYYGVDCASGCIWNLDAVESVTPKVT